MGKRGGKRKFIQNADTVKKKVKKEQVWRDHKEIHQNSYFRKYYQMQLQPYFNGDQKQFAVFWEHMKIKLPVVFRINPNQPNYSSFRQKLFNQQFMASQFKQQKVQGEFQPQEIPKIEQIKWYPNNLVYTMNTNKQILKKSKMLSAFHAYLQKATDSGLVTRQELVSMLPPLYLNVKSDDLILDMCAAPGSKTSQLLQMLYNEQRTLIKGCVIANDVQYSRAKMLIHQVQRAGTSGMAVINHDAQFLPQLYTHRQGSIKQKFLFDKILCDVPCSGDGATRKLPNKWSNWHSNDGMVLHPLQLNLLIKGINMLKPGGLLLYSTCSINPIQDEAVVLELMRRVQYGLKVVDIHKKYDVKGRRGLINWKICASKGTQHKMTELKSNQQQLFTIYKNYQQAKQNHRVKPSMFPESYEKMINYGIQNTMRILPHDQNSGGFFIALLEKEKQFSWKYQQKKVKVQTIEQQQNQINEIMQKVQQNVGRQEEQIIQKKQGQIEEEVQEVQQIINEIKQVKQQKLILIPKPTENQKKSNRYNKQKPRKPDQYEPINQEQFQYIKSFYGIQDDNFRNVLFVRKAQDFRKKVTLVSQGISKFLSADQYHKLKLINMGCKVFEKGKQSFSGNECLYRICQDAIHFILPVITKRKIRISLNLFKKLIIKVNIKHTQIQDEEQRKRLGEISQGSFAVYIEQNILGKVVVDALAAQNFKFSMNVMISKQELESLKIRYL